jgi:hypothetical protein
LGRGDFGQCLADQRRQLGAVPQHAVVSRSPTAVHPLPLDQKGRTTPERLLDPLDELGRPW